MDLGKEEKQIQEIKELKGQLLGWRWGFMGVGVLVAISAIGSVNSSFRGLVDKGPTQDKFVKHLTEELNNDVKPLIEDMAKQTISEVQPEINKAVDEVNAQMPILAQNALAELDQLQTNLPARGEKVLREAFVAMLQKKETDLQEMFPEATEEQIERLLTNLAESAGKEAEGAAVELFGKHHDALMAIHKHIGVISEKEAASLQGVDPSWEMGLLVMDIFREDLERNRPDKSSVMAKQTEEFSSAKTVSTKKGDKK